MKRFALWTALLILVSLPLTAGMISLPMAQPTGMVLHGGDLWVADRATGKIFILDPATGKTLRSFLSPAEAPLGMTLDNDDNLYIADDVTHHIYIYHIPDGTTRVMEELEVTPRGLAWDGKYLWATARGKVVKLDPQDGSEMVTREASGRYATGITYDGRYLWVAERLHDEVGLYTDDGTLLSLHPSPGPYPWGIVRNGETLYLCDYQTRSLTTIDLTKPHSPFTVDPESHHRTLLFTHQIHNWGPDPLTHAEIYIALPHNDIHQILRKPVTLSPRHTRVEDVYGQGFARFAVDNLKQNASLTATMAVDVETHDIHAFFLPDWVGTLDEIPEEIRTTYTRESSKLLINHPVVQHLSKEIVGSETNAFMIAFKIHHYLMTNMAYQLSGGWNVAPTILERGNGSCSEFTIAFIALARAAGLPARYEAGVVVRGDDASIDDVYHRWVQVYLPPFGWVPVDSSYGKPSSARTIAREFGTLSNRFLITTHSGGDSPYLGWTYNSFSTYTFKGRARAETRTWAKWEPAPKGDDPIATRHPAGASAKPSSTPFAKGATGEGAACRLPKVP